MKSSVLEKLRPVGRPPAADPNVLEIDKKANEDPILRLWQEGFDEEPEETRPLLRSRLGDASCFGVQEGERLSTMLFIKPMEMRLGADSVPAGFIIGVSTAADLRGQGLSSAAIKKAMARCREQGAKQFYLATLIPAFYERIGFTVQQESWLYSIEPKADDGLRVVPFTPCSANVRELLECYEQAADCNGAFLRTAEDMAWKLEDIGGGAAVYDGGTMVAYCLKPRGGHAEETVYTDIRALRALADYYPDALFRLSAPETDECAMRESYALSQMLYGAERVAGFCNYDEY